MSNRSYYFGKVPSHRIQRDPEPSPDRARRVALDPKSPDVSDLFSRERPTDPPPVQGRRKLNDAEDCLGDDYESSLRRF